MEKIRYAVVGIGHIAQAAVLPAFRHAKKNSVLAALVTGDLKKSLKVAEKYETLNPHLEVVPYDHYENLLDSGTIDAVYIATPNHRHTEFALPALERGIHVLCEKPLALNIEDCERMIAVSEETGARLMTAYRLHFEASSLRALQLLRDGEIGNPRYCNAVFSFQLEDRKNIRLRKETGGGPLWDIGVYCINAARTLFGAEPIEVISLGIGNTEKRFKEVDEMVGAVLTFPGDRLASFVCSFGAAEAGTLEVYGTEGHLRLEDAFEYATSRELRVKREASHRTRIFRYARSDQFAPELLYFSQCILKHELPEPSGLEGLADVRVILALKESMKTGKKIVLEEETVLERKPKPRPAQKITKPPVKKPSEVQARSPH